MFLGRYSEAAKAMNIPDTVSAIDLSYRAALAARTGKQAEAERLLNQLRRSDFAYFQTAEVLAQLGRKDEAIRTLESAWDTRDQASRPFWSIRFSTRFAATLGSKRS